MRKYLLAIIIFCVTLQIKAQTVSDADGNTYNTVTIGTQTWMKENLKTTKYKDGTAIPNITGTSDWFALTTPAYCWYNNDANLYKPVYGAMYNWVTVNSGKVCPTGWHVPSNDEWIILYTFLGGMNNAGIKLKEAGSTHWLLDNLGDNASGFTGLPGGRRVDGANFSTIGHVGEWWSSTENNTSTAMEFGLTDNESYVLLFSGDKKRGLSVRCLKDNNTSAVNTLGNMDKVIYPNPVNDRLFIKNSKKSNLQVVIFDLEGKQVSNMVINSDYIDVSNLSTGTYILKIIDSGKVVITKLIKE